MNVIWKTALQLMAIACWVLMLPISAGGQQIDTQANVAEQYLQTAADVERAALHLPPLRWDPALASAARVHAMEMVSHGSISHQFQDEPDLAARGSAAGARFSLISENVAVSSSAVQIHSAWMHSEGHRHNLLDPNVDSVGIAVVARGHRLFAVEDFERGIGEVSLRQQEEDVAKAIGTEGIAIRESTAVSKRVCASESGNDKQAAFVMRYTTANLTRIPAQLRSRLETGNYSSAVVAACADESGSDFSMYRIAVLLYR